MKNQIIVAILFSALAMSGCSKEETAYRTPEMIQWDFSDLNMRVSTNSGRIEALENIVGARTIPKATSSKLTKVALSGPAFTQDEIDIAVEDATADLQGELNELKETVETFQSATPTPQSVVEGPVYSEPQQTFSAPQTYATGPKTYSAPVQSGYKSVMKTKRVAKTVYEDVPVEVKVPVMKRAVYQTVNKQVPYQTQKTVMRTEQRTRTKNRQR